MARYGRYLLAVGSTMPGVEYPKARVLQGPVSLVRRITPCVCAPRHAFVYCWTTLFAASFLCWLRVEKRGNVGHCGVDVTAPEVAQA